MIACSGMVLVLAHIGPRQKAEGHYGCPQTNTKAIPLQATINLFLGLAPRLRINSWVQPSHYLTEKNKFN